MLGKAIDPGRVHGDWEGLGVNWSCSGEWGWCVLAGPAVFAAREVLAIRWGHIHSGTARSWLGWECHLGHNHHGREQLDYLNASQAEGVVTKDD